MTQVRDLIPTTEINPDCTVCNGTGTDLAFGGRCSMCWWSPMHTSLSESPMVERFSGNRSARQGTTIVDNEPSDKQIALIIKLAAQAGVEVEIPTNRKLASVLIEKLLGRTEAPNAITVAPAAAKPASAKWAKVEGVWMVRVTNMVVHEGDTIKVTKANGEIKDVTLGVQYGDDLWNVAAPKAKASSVDVPEGRYAVRGIDGERGDILFVKVDRPTDGRWAGYTFVKQIVGGHPEYPIKGARAAAVLARIAEAGVKESAMLYGQEIKRCARCHIKLTSEYRKIGIGPECIKHY